ncbi:MAG TPA: FAD-binding oxidoreductase [Stellaceae bacterium]|nr:FAD-binding oxidoreductase [Stellaceae bacterium]
MMRVSGWGRFPQVETHCVDMRDVADARAALADHASLIARGNGRSYGDAALNASCVLSTTRSDRILAFDPASGCVTVEAGLLLADLLDFAVPRGWFPPVMPGTKLVTIGGMIAADVHGKNHHFAGTFSRHVESLLLMMADGSIRRCLPGQEDELFEATCGGMGLTGIILEATIRLMRIESTSLRQETLRARDFDEAMALCEDSAGHSYSVAWIDCLARGSALGRALIYRGEHAGKDEAGATPLAVPARQLRRMPFDLPQMVLNPWSVRAFNEFYYRRARPGIALVDYETFFFPLDALLDWNRLDGRSGFTQHQCVIPKAASRAAIRALLERVSAAGYGSFLAVLKLFGGEGDGLLSFPREGYTLTLDFPRNPATLALLRELDAIVADHGGRLYLAKDARADAAMMRRGYSRLDRFKRVRDTMDPQRKFASAQSQRLDL